MSSSLLVATRISVKLLRKQHQIELFKWINNDYGWLYEYASMPDSLKRYHRQRSDMEEMGLNYEKE